MKPACAVIGNRDVEHIASKIVAAVATHKEAPEIMHKMTGVAFAQCRESCSCCGFPPFSSWTSRGGVSLPLLLTTCKPISILFVFYQTTLQNVMQTFEWTFGMFVLFDTCMTRMIKSTASMITSTCTAAKQQIDRDRC